MAKHVSDDVIVSERTALQKELPGEADKGDEVWRQVVKAIPVDMGVANTNIEWTAVDRPGHPPWCGHVLVTSPFEELLSDGVQPVRSNRWSICLHDEEVGVAKCREGHFVFVVDQLPPHDATSEIVRVVGPG